MKRRTFLTRLGACTAGGLLARTDTVLSAQTQTRLGPLGIQLWAVRHELQQDFRRTLVRLAAIGYRNVELVSWFGHFGQSAAGLGAALRDAGLRATSTHISSGAVLLGWQRHLDDARALGVQYVVCNSFSTDEVTSLDDWRERADRFNQAGDIARQAGIWLAFHSEPDVFTSINGQIPYDVFIQRTDPDKVRMQLDTGNIMAAGRDPIEYLRQYPTRYWSFHLKDRGRPPSSTDVAVGDGIGRFKELLSLIPNLEQKEFFVEFEVEEAELDLAETSYQYLRSLNF